MRAGAVRQQGCTRLRVAALLLAAQATAWAQSPEPPSISLPAEVIEQDAERPVAEWPARTPDAAEGDSPEQTPDASVAQLRLLTWGGRYRQHLETAALMAFSSRSDLAVQTLEYGESAEPPLALLESGEIDLAVVERADARRGCRLGVLRPVPLLSLPGGDESGSALQDFLPDSLETCAVPLLRWSQALFVVTETADARVASRLEDFFDPVRFPGRRVAAASPVGLLELALLADGVVPQAVYPTLDTAAGLDRALARLRELAPAMLWVASGAEVIAALGGGQAVMGFATTLDWTATGAGYSSLHLLRDGEILHTDMLVLPAGRASAEDAWRLLVAMTGTNAQALMAQLGGYAPVRRSATARLSRDLLTRLPGQAVEGRRNLAFDGEWWQGNEARVRPLFERLLPP